MNLKEFTDTTITFEGSFYIDEEDLPVERLIYTDEGMFLIRILSTKNLKNTSEYFEDEEGKICLFPTYILTISYEIVREIKTGKEYYEEEIRLTFEWHEYEKQKRAALLKEIESGNT